MRGGGQQEATKFFCEKCCWADAATSYFKEGEGLGIYTLLQVWGRLKFLLVHIIISNDVPAYVVKYVRIYIRRCGRICS